MKRTTFLLFLALAGLLLAIGLAAPAIAENGRGAGGKGHDHDRAREAVSQQDARPLATILPRIERRYRARMVELEFETAGRHPVYKIELITPSGRIIDVLVDAATGDIVSDDLGGDDK